MAFIATAKPLVGAWRAIPATYDLPLKAVRCGLRPVTADNEPVMRRSAVADNLVYAYGHGRNGVLLAPLNGHRVADLIAPA